MFELVKGEPWGWSGMRIRFRAGVDHAKANIFMAIFRFFRTRL
jgi:hypothetical protein